MREDEAAFVLHEIIRQEQQRLQRVLKPFMDELCNLEARKPPRPVELPDGRVMIYKGPSAEDIAGPYKAPKWLEELAAQDDLIRYQLSRYRRGNG